MPTLTATVLQGRPGGFLIGVVRINAAFARPVLYAGTAEPGGTWPNQGAVALAKRSGLVAAFNSGFDTYASGGSWFHYGRAAVPLRAGAASLAGTTQLTVIRCGARSNASALVIPASPAFAVTT